MKRWNAKTLTLVICLGLRLTGCADAPRDNPLDPLSPDYNDTGQIQIHTQRYYPPNLPLGNVTIFITPENIVRTTDEHGELVVGNLHSGQYQIIASKEGYAPDTLAVKVTAGKQENIFVPLNALPAFRNLSIRSEHLRVWFPVTTPDIFRLAVSAQLDDGDGIQDISEITLHAESLGALKTWTWQKATQRFEAIIEAGLLTSQTMYDLVGEGFFLEARDRPGGATVSSTVHLSRVIDPTPVASEPQGFKVVGSRPQFVWSPVEVPFEFTFRINIARVFPESNIVEQFEHIDNISPDSSSVVPNFDLPPGFYLWTVSIVDRWGNLSRSREAVFSVQ